MRLLTPRRLALCGGFAAIGALCWFIPPWAHGDDGSLPPDPTVSTTADVLPLTAATAQAAPVTIAGATTPAAPAISSETDAPKAVIVADTDSASGALALADETISEASPVGGEEKTLAATTRPDTTKTAPAPSGSSWRATHPLRNGADTSTADWEQVSAFLAAHSPVRGSVIAALPDSQRRVNMMASATRDFHTYERAINNPALAATVLDRVKLEDEIFDLARQVRQASASAQDAIKDQLRQKVGDLVDTSLKERELWLDGLKSSVTAQERALTVDRAHRDDIVRQRFDQIVRRAQSFNFWPNASHDNKPTSQPTK